MQRWWVQGCSGHETWVRECQGRPGKPKRTVIFWGREQVFSLLLQLSPLFSVRAIWFTVLCPAEKIAFSSSLGDCTLDVLVTLGKWTSKKSPSKGKGKWLVQGHFAFYCLPYRNRDIRSIAQLPCCTFWMWWPRGWEPAPRMPEEKDRNHLDPHGSILCCQLSQPAAHHTSLWRSPGMQASPLDTFPNDYRCKP